MTGEGRAAQNSFRKLTIEIDRSHLRKAPVRPLCSNSGSRRTSTSGAVKYHRGRQIEVQQRPARHARAEYQISTSLCHAAGFVLERASASRPMDVGSEGTDIGYNRLAATRSIRSGAACSLPSSPALRSRLRVAANKSYSRFNSYSLDLAIQRRALDAQDRRRLALVPVGVLERFRGCALFSTSSSDRGLVDRRIDRGRTAGVRATTARCRSTSSIGPLPEATTPPARSRCAVRGRCRASGTDRLSFPSPRGEKPLNLAGPSRGRTASGNARPASACRSGARAAAARRSPPPAGGRTGRGGTSAAHGLLQRRSSPPPRAQSTWIGMLPPTRSNGWPSSTRRNLACVPSGHLADLVEEDRALVGRLELADLLLGRAGERALLVAEQLAFQQRLGQRGAVEADERPVACAGW